MTESNDIYNQDLKRVVAVIVPSKLKEVRFALEEAGYEDVDVSEVRAMTTSKNDKFLTQIFRGATYAIDFLPREKLEVFVSAHEVDNIMACIKDAAALDVNDPLYTQYTDDIGGDGLIYVTDNAVLRDIAIDPDSLAQGA